MTRPSRFARRLAAAAGLSLGAACAALTAQAGPVFYAAQGPDWGRSEREAFYFTDQGSRIMPLAWMRALKAPDGAGFLADGLARYGYIQGENGPAADIPVGFTLAPTKASGDMIGMTCAACHTRQIEIEGASWRLDGGPAIVDFQAFLADLDKGMLAALKDEASFKAFGDAVLGEGADADARARLRVEADLWSKRFHTLVERSLPHPEWGPGRLDAVSMIFNRLTGLDIGEGEDRLIPENIAVANAPTRYPFLWNAARQDLTQWPGFAQNGTALLGLARNLGEVYGVFGDFQPQKRGFSILRLNRDYMKHNSANFDGLDKLEDLIWKIGPPAWPIGLDSELVKRGAEIFGRHPSDGGCNSCHGIAPGEFRLTAKEPLWKTRLTAEGTDDAECKLLGRKVKTGMMSGARIPFVVDTLGDEAPAFTVLKTAVLGAIIQQKLGGRSDVESIGEEVLAELAPEQIDRDIVELRGAFPELLAADPAAESTPGQDACKYEARVLEGIWAAAPYLHNGSVPTLADLLKPAAERPESFSMGPAYDMEKVGIAAEQSAFGKSIVTTGCDDLSSGNSRCGHEWGVHLAEEEKRALLEYLKSL